MARIRTIKPDFWTSTQVVECSTTARLMFIGIWNFSDDQGIHPADPARLKMEVFPGDAFTVEYVETLINELKRVDLLRGYEVDGKRYWIVTGWYHQKIDKPTKKYPPPPEGVKFESPSDNEPPDNPPGALPEPSPPDVDKDIDVEKDEDKDVTSCRKNRFSDVDLNVAHWMFFLIRKNLNPDHKEPNLRTWANTIRLMRERDGRSENQIRILFEWANQHEFWCSNILSPGKLRKQWDTLAIKIRADKRKPKLQVVKNDSAPREYESTDLDSIAWTKDDNGGED